MVLHSWALRAHKELRYNREKKQNKKGKIYIDSIFLYITMKKEVLLNI